MDVFLIPLRPPSASGDPEFVLYCEAPASPIEPEVEGAPRRGLVARSIARFKQAMAEGEEEQRRQEAGHPETRSGSRVGRLMKRKLASAVAEHRLLWALRRHSHATLHHPDNVPPDRALTWAIEEFRRDYSKHRLWCVVDGVVVAASALLALLPGPNVVAYYFIFLTVGHYFSLRGAQVGIRRETWTTQVAPALTDVGAAWSVPDSERDARISGAAHQLGLERLVYFARRIAPNPIRRP